MSLEITENQNLEIVCEINTSDNLYFSNAETINDAGIWNKGGESDEEDTDENCEFPEAAVGQEVCLFTRSREDDEEVSNQYEL